MVCLRWSGLIVYATLTRTKSYRPQWGDHTTHKQGMLNASESAHLPRWSVHFNHTRLTTRTPTLSTFLMTKLRLLADVTQRNTVLRCWQLVDHT